MPGEVRKILDHDVSFDPWIREQFEKELDLLKHYRLKPERTQPVQSELKPGDLVKLRSGGPLMTVNSPNHSFTSQLECVWMLDLNDMYTLGTGFFHQSALVPCLPDGRPKPML